MNEILLNQVQPGISFTDDAYILEDMFFLPKNLPIQSYHITLLRQWGIDTIYTDGRASNIGMEKVVEEKADMKEYEKALETLEPSMEQESGDKISIDTSSKNATALLDGSIKSLVELYKVWIKKTIKIFNDILIKKEVDKEDVKELISEIINTVNKNKNNALMLLGRNFEGILYIHTQTIETVILAYIIGESMNLSELTLSNLAIATYFHDLGMLKVPRMILEKKGALNEEEIKIIRNHPNVGYQYLRDIKYSAIVASGALQHHERMDGKGYPNGLSPDRITEIAKIISVVDAYCAAIASKPFKQSPQHAKEIIQDLLRGGGSKYDPAILKELIKSISFYPIGSLVLLSNAKPARIVGTSGVAMKPIVRIIVNGKDENTVDLSKDDKLYIKGLYASQSPA